MPNRHLFSKEKLCYRFSILKKQHVNPLTHKNLIIPFFKATNEHVLLLNIKEHNSNFPQT